MKKKKKRMLYLMLFMIILIVMYTIPVSAATSYLDVRAGDTSSYATWKESGANWENKWYVTVNMVGNISAWSSATDGSIESTHVPLINGAQSWNYRNDMTAYGGKYYILYTYPNLGSPSNWSVTGRYTP